MGLGLALDTLALGFRATVESWTCPLVDMALLIYVRLGTPLVDSETCSAKLQAKGCHHLQLDTWLGQEESSDQLMLGPKTNISPSGSSKSFKLRRHNKILSGLRFTPGTV